VTLLAPVPAPQKIICVGRNYVDHAAEMGATVETLPVIFNKFPSSIVGPNDSVHLPPISEAVDYEAELVVVIGKVVHNVTEKQAPDCIFGFCCGNDVTARDWQKGRPGNQWLLGKSFDTFAPIGPWIVSRDSLEMHNLDIQLRLNGNVMQSSNTRHLIFKIDFLVSHISRFCTLQPGDLIFTGTPGGVGSGRQPPVYLKHGDRMSVEIAGVGCLENQVVGMASNE
jgi:2-keto-4-pentenoate hydratase/2-oxohepta-3-ene-1,7-dioic acid hydratase in catechol pathway